MRPDRCASSMNLAATLSATASTNNPCQNGNATAGTSSTRLKPSAVLRPGRRHGASLGVRIANNPERSNRRTARQFSQA